MADITPLGMMIRKLRLERQETLGAMAQALDVTSAYLSAVEHGKKSINENLVQQVHLYFKDSKLSLEDWKSLANDSQPQMKLDLGSDRALKLKFGRTIDALSEIKKQAIQDLLDGGFSETKT